MKESKKALTNKDLNQMALHSFLLQMNFNYERMQGTGFAAAMAPTLKKIYKDDTEGLGNALVEHSKFINTSPPLAPFVMGVVASMEEEGAPRETVNAVKNALFPPVAGIGDAIAWFTALPLAAGIGCSIAAQGSFLGVFLFIAIMAGMNCLKWPTAHWGYRLGTRAIGMLGDRLGKITTAASIVSATILGALIATYVNFSFAIEIPLSETFVFNLQTDFFDNILPRLVPAAFTALIYWFYRKKKVSPTKLIIGILVVCILFKYIGIA